MTSSNALELKGDFRAHPVAELLVEIVHATLSGSLRVSNGKVKVVIYFRDGTMVYAASNAREHRLFSALLSRRRIDQKTLADIPNFANDLELASALEAQGVFTKRQIDELIIAQIETIMIDVLTWPQGQWHFSSLARLREDLVYNIDIYKILLGYGRCLPSEIVYQRFRSVQEAFYRAPNTSTDDLLQSHETYVLDLFGDSPSTIEQLRPKCNLPETAMMQTLYVLWLGGLLLRLDWNAAFSANKIGEILTARVSRIKQATDLIKKEKEPEPEPVPAPEEAEKLPALNLSIEDYLVRVEGAETYYDVLGVEDSAKPAEIKNSYFALAKLCHPDRFHREDAVKLRRIQVAFTQIAHAYETLKSDEGRKNYDYKLSKELEYRRKRKESAEAAGVQPGDHQAENGLESFEKGLEALGDEEYAAAAGHLSRAVHYSPQNALYHAYFGHALSNLEKQHHKAEASLQTAVRLDPTNPKVRMMLVEFFMEMKMLKRAEGELKRFLEAVPGNKEATALLAKIQVPVP